MAWPVNARVRDFISTVTTITAASLNGIQDAIIGLYGGTKSVLALAIDGVGNTTIAPTAGQLIIDGKAAASTAAVVFSDATAAGAYNLRIQTPTNGTGRVRHYEVRGGWVITTNASYTGNVGAEWARDVAGTATRMTLVSGTFTTQGITTPGGTWAEADWDSAVASTVDGDVSIGRDLLVGRSVSATDTVGARYFAGSGSAPTVAAGVAAGVGATAAISAGTNSSGRVTITPAGAPGIGVYATVTFAHGGFAAAPNGVTLSPANAAAAALGDLFYVDPASITATTFDISKGVASATVPYQFIYTVIA